MERNKLMERNIKLIYLHAFLSSMLFSVPIFVLFWQENGLSLTKIMLLQSFFAITTVALEIPSGYFADIFGRKRTLLIASISRLLSVIAYSLGHSFLHFLIAELFFAITNSFVSGTLSAITYDSLLANGKESEYKIVWGKTYYYWLVGLAVSNAIGGLIAGFGLRLTLFASMPFFALAIPIVLMLSEPERQTLIIGQGYLKQLLAVFKTVFNNRKLKWIILYSAVVYAFNQSALWLYQPYFKLSGISIVYFGLVFASFQLVAAISSRFADRIEEKLGQRFSLLMLIFLVGISILLMANFVYLFSFSFAFMQQFVRGFKNIAVSNYINKVTDSSIRATVLSIEGFVSKLLYAAIIPMVGWLADAYSLVQALAVIGVTALVLGVILVTIMLKKQILSD